MVNCLNSCHAMTQGMPAGDFRGPHTDLFDGVLFAALNLLTIYEMNNAISPALGMLGMRTP